MVEVTREGIILRKTKLSFENEGVLNPAIFQDGNTIHLFYRAVKSRNNSSIGYCKLEGPIQVVERALIAIYRQWRNKIVRFCIS